MGRSWARLLAAAGVAAIAPGLAVAKRPTRSFAGCPAGGPGVAADLATAVDKAVENALATEGSVLAGAGLAKKLKDPGATLDKCAGAVACIAKLGKRLKVSHIVW